ncbi:disaggregatase related repeat-containing protein [Methanosarcina sp. 1.H.A.2.2]|uniref:disaggregatase related repeat-containing protein n=1 Tax=Methanosarcina sp. 1.H.A.2.2 TaxID=1483601 RepID=UPI0009E2F049|nr:disaggregatase related repeat-containing protein [Methanosarcina sp. 1.H.A.2.2]
MTSCLVLSGIPAALCMSSAPVVYVAGDGSGDFNCDGKDDHIQINQALKFVAENSAYTTVHLKGPFTYVIDETLLIGSNTILEGDSSAKIKLVSNANWAAWKPMIKERSTGSSGITIRGFTIDGNREGNTNVVSGKGYYNLIHLSSCQNINVYNMYLTNNHGDGLKTDKCTSVKLYNNKIYLLGHDGLYASSCSNVEAYNNIITCRTNSGLRLYNTNKASFHDNVITSEGSGGAGIEIQKYNTPSMDDIEVYNNVIYKTALAGIWIFGSGSYSASTANVHIHHNQIYDTGTKTSNSIIGGILSNGFGGLIENNVIDGTYGAGVVQKTVYSPAPSGSGFVLTIRNNIITNSRSSSAGGSGYAVNNELKGTHSFALQNNCFYGNAGGEYKNVQASSSDIKADPQYADRNSRDYHLKSKAGRWDGNGWITDSTSSSCIDTGYSSSDYSAEPQDNGGRINIGAFGNTKYASKSGTSTVDNNQAPVINSIPDVSVEAGKSLTFTVSASDADGDSLAYSASGTPSGATFDSKSGFFSWTPAAGQEGTYSVTFEVSDGKLKDSATAAISVVAQENSSPAAEEVYDNRLREASPNTVYQGSSFIDVGGMNSFRYRDVMRFDLSEYADSGEVGNAILSLYWYYPSGTLRPEDTVIEVYRPAASWNPDYVSWSKKDKGVAWNNAGGDWYDKNGVLQGSTPYATITLKASELPDSTYHELDVTGLVKEYASGKYENTGFLIKARTENNNYIAFYSTEAGNENRKPRLTVTEQAAVNPVIDVTVTGAKDNRLREASSNTVYQSSSFIDIGGIGGVGRYRDVMRFDLSEYEASGEVINAALSLYWYYPSRTSRPEDTVIEVYRPAASWNPDYVSWNKKDNGVAWNNAGGDWYDKNGVLQGSTPYATITLKASELPDSTYHEIDVTDLVNEYASGKYENTGFLIKARTENNNYIAFYSTEAGSETQRPKLNLQLKP